MDTTAGFNVDRRDMKADGVIMHRERNVIAVRATAPGNENSTIIQVSGLSKLDRLSNLSDREKRALF